MTDDVPTRVYFNDRGSLILKKGDQSMYLLKAGDEVWVDLPGFEDATQGEAVHVTQKGPVRERPEDQDATLLLLKQDPRTQRWRCAVLSDYLAPDTGPVEELRGAVVKVMLKASQEETVDFTPLLEALAETGGIPEVLQARYAPLLDKGEDEEAEVQA